MLTIFGQRDQSRTLVLLLSCGLVDIISSKSVFGLDKTAAVNYELFGYFILFSSRPFNPDGMSGTPIRVI